MGECAGCVMVMGEQRLRHPNHGGSVGKVGWMSHEREGLGASGGF